MAQYPDTGSEWANEVLSRLGWGVERQRVWMDAVGSPAALDSFIEQGVLRNLPGNPTLADLQAFPRRRDFTVFCSKCRTTAIKAIESHVNGSEATQLVPYWTLLIIGGYPQHKLSTILGLDSDMVLKLAVTQRLPLEHIRQAILHPEVDTMLIGSLMTGAEGIDKVM